MGIIEPGSAAWAETAEAALLEFARNGESESYRLTVTAVGDWWTIELVDLNSRDPGQIVTGGGATFADAWHSMLPAWADSGSDAYQALAAPRPLLRGRPKLAIVSRDKGDR